MIILLQTPETGRDVFRTDGRRARTPTLLSSKKGVRMEADGEREREREIKV